MATEAQRLIGISLAKIAQSRCGRGGVSLHKNLLVATVLQKARFIFMEEAYHMVHGHYLQANKYLEPDIDIRDDPNDTVPSTDNIDECELDDIFDTPASSIGKDEDSSEDFSEALCNKENSPPETTNTTSSNNSGLVYLDLDKHIKAGNESTNTTTTTTTTGNNNKRRREISEWETEEAVLSILPKKIKSDTSDSSSDSDSESIYSPDDEIFLSDRISSSSSSSTNHDDNTAAINLSVNVSRELEMDELNNNISNNNNNNYVSNNNNNTTGSNNDNNTTTTTNSNNNTNNLQNGPSMEGIDRITSLVSIFSFGNMTRSVSTPDLCSAQATKDSCSSESSISQRTYLAMTV